MNDPLNKLGNALRPDAQAFDEVRIVTVPRYKQSGLSGDEWRISAEIQLFRKGQLLVRQTYRNVESACSYALTVYHSATDSGQAYFAGERNLCDQEGCAEPATVTYRKKFEYCNAGHQSPVHPIAAIRHFCEKHRIRGDCGMDDADANYELIPEPKSFIKCTHPNCGGDPPNTYCAEDCKDQIILTKHGF